MSIKIELRFISTPDIELQRKGIDIDVIRLLGMAQFLGKKGWSEPTTAIIDTGAPISTIPLDIWRKAEVNILGSHRLWGVIPKEECSMEVKAGRISLRLVDRINKAKKMDIVAYLLPVNAIPLILGFEGLLGNCDLFLSCPKEKAYIEV